MKKIQKRSKTAPETETFQRNYAKKDTRKEPQTPKKKYQSEQSSLTNKPGTRYGSVK